MKLAEAIKTKGKINSPNGVALNIMHTAYCVKSAINLLLKQYALTSEQYNILRILKGAPQEKMCVKQIAERLIERNANVPRTIDRLVLKKLIKRSSSSVDKRETVSEITQAGKNLLEAVAPALNKLVKESCGLNDHEIELLNDLLDKYRSI